MSFLGWFVEHLADVRSDMSRFHRVDEVEAMTAERFVEYTPRLTAYDGVVARRLRNEQQSAESEPQDPQAHAFNPTPEDLARLYPAEPGAGQLAPMFEHAVV